MCATGTIIAVEGPPSSACGPTTTAATIKTRISQASARAGRHFAPQWAAGSPAASIPWRCGCGRATSDTECATTIDTTVSAADLFPELGLGTTAIVAFYASVGLKAAVPAPKRRPAARERPARRYDVCDAASHPAQQPGGSRRTARRSTAGS